MGDGMNYDKAMAERAYWTAELEKRGFEVPAGGVFLATGEWDITVSRWVGDAQVEDTLYGADEVRRWLAEREAEQEWPEVTR